MHNNPPQSTLVKKSNVVFRKLFKHNELLIYSLGYVGVVDEMKYVN